MMRRVAKPHPAHDSRGLSEGLASKAEACRLDQVHHQCVDPDVELPAGNSKLLPFIINFENIPIWILLKESWGY